MWHLIEYWSGMCINIWTSIFNIPLSWWNAMDKCNRSNLVFGGNVDSWIDFIHKITNLNKRFIQPTKFAKTAFK